MHIFHEDDKDMPVKMILLPVRAAAAAAAAVAIDLRRIDASPLFDFP